MNKQLFSCDHMDELAVLKNVTGKIFGKKIGAEKALILLNEFGSLKNVMSANKQDLCQRAGMSPCFGLEIDRLQLLTKAILRNDVFSQPVFDNTSKILDYYRVKFNDINTEQFHAILLNRNLNIIHEKCMQTGTVDDLITYPRELIRYVLRYNASHVILIFNRPNKSAEPTLSDFAKFARIIKLGKQLSLKLFDYIIISNNGHYSFRKEKLMIEITYKGT